MSLQVNVGLLTSQAGRYANAYFRVCLEKGKIEEAHAELNGILSLYHQCEPFLNSLTSGHLSKSQKLVLWDEIANHLKLSQSLSNFINVLIDEKQVQILPEIAGIYEQMLLAHQGVIPVKIESSVPLNSEQKQELERNLVLRYKANVKVQYISYPALLTGIKVQRGCEVIDMSLRRQLRCLEATIEREV